jgi:xylulokinase
MSHKKKHFIRSVLEGISYSIKDCFLHKYSIQDESSLLEFPNKNAVLIGGGSKSDLWSQILSDVVGIKLQRPESSDASFGAALIGGVAINIFEDFKDAFRKCIRITSEVIPNRKDNEIYEKEFIRYKKIHDALADIYKY